MSKWAQFDIVKGYNLIDFLPTTPRSISVLIPELFRTIDDFSQNKVAIDWSLAWENEEHQETLFDGLEIVQEALCLVPDIDQSQRLLFVGRLALLRSNLDFTVSLSHDETTFFSLCKELEDLIKEIISYGSWLGLAQQRHNAFLKYIQEQETNEDATPDAQQMIFFQPVLLGIGISSIITFDQEESDEGTEFEFCLKDCDDEECDAHDDEESGA